MTFLHMSGYGAYVWSCYGLTLAVLVWNVWARATPAARADRAAPASRRRRQGGEASHDAASSSHDAGRADRARRGRRGGASRSPRFRTTCCISTRRRDVAAGKAPTDRVFRVGGMVPEGSFKRPPGSLEARFVLTDFAEERHGAATRGVLPDLFREGQGVIARGRLGCRRSVRRRGSARQARRELHAARSRRHAAQAARQKAPRDRRRRRAAQS